MYDALPRAGSQISKGYPASMLKVGQLARPQTSLQFHTSKRPGPGHVAPLAVAQAQSTPMAGYAPPSRAGTAQTRAPLRASNAFGTPNLPTIPGYADHGAPAEVTSTITELPHPARVAEAAKPMPHHLRASMTSLRRDAENLSAQVPRPPEEKGPPQILKQVLREGHGAAARKGDTLEVSYIGWFAGQEGLTATSLTPGQIFDKAPYFQFRLGSGDVIPGWDHGLQGMREGEVARLAVPAQVCMCARVCVRARVRVCVP